VLPPSTVRLKDRFCAALHFRAVTRLTYAAEGNSVCTAAASPAFDSPLAKARASLRASTTRSMMTSAPLSGPGQENSLQRIVHSSHTQSAFAVRSRRLSRTAGHRSQAGKRLNTPAHQWSIWYVSPLSVFADVIASRLRQPLITQTHSSCTRRQLRGACAVPKHRRTSRRRFENPCATSRTGRQHRPDAPFQSSTRMCDDQRLSALSGCATALRQHVTSDSESRWVRGWLPPPPRYHL
jgi:hypothetical protein